MNNYTVDKITFYPQQNDIYLTNYKELINLVIKLYIHW